VPDRLLIGCLEIMDVQHLAGAGNFWQNAPTSARNSG
jgi:hypothetical protein